MRWHRYSKAVLGTARWQRVRKLVLSRDNYRCVQCQARGRLEIDHIVPVRDDPDKAYDLDNLQALCRPCHSVKTRAEVHGGTVRKPDPEAIKWKELLRREI